MAAGSNLRTFSGRFFEAGCDDATIACQKGVIILEFAREARSFFHAIHSAMACVQAAGAKVERVEPDDLVSLSEIAQRSGLTRSAVSLYAAGERGQEFPPPVARVTSDSPLWDWVEVARWLYRRRTIGFEVLLRAKVVRYVNCRVTARAIGGRSEHRLFLRRQTAATG